MCDELVYKGEMFSELDTYLKNYTQQHYFLPLRLQKQIFIKDRFPNTGVLFLIYNNNTIGSVFTCVVTWHLSEFPRNVVNITESLRRSVVTIL